MSNKPLAFTGTREQWIDYARELQAELEVTESRRRDWERAAEMWKGEYEALLDTKGRER